MATNNRDREHSNKQLTDSQTREQRKNEIIGLLLMALGLFSAIALFTDTAGMFGEVLAEYYLKALGMGSYLLPLLITIWGITLIKYKGFNFNSRLAGFLLVYITAITSYHTYFFTGFPLKFTSSTDGGGLVGGWLSWVLLELFGKGAYIVLGTLLLIGFLLWFDILLQSIIEKLREQIHRLLAAGRRLFASLDFSRADPVESYESYTGEETGTDLVEVEETDVFDYEEVEEFEFTEDDKAQPVSETAADNEETDKQEQGNGAHYYLPRISLLKKADNKKLKLKNKTELLEDTLESFGVEASVKQVTYGPTITRYEVQPATGVKVSKIVNLADDIALALAASDVRIEAPIPGKAAVGIEVPHQGNMLVRLREIIRSRKFQEADSKLTLALGKGIDGEPIIADLSQMPHLLVAGATGSGKSVGMNAMITSILYKSTPDEVKMILIDPKRVELSNYEGLPHLFSPVVTDPKKAANVLKLVVQEMEDRYELFSESGTRGITSYNKKASEEERLPYIVVIIDELSDLMMVAASEVEDNICRLAQMSRAAGIHLVIATQRPSVDVITGLIKANIPSRISFAVSSQTDSRTILDMGGAEKLLGNGDMLFFPVDAQKPKRIQGAFIDNEEIEDIVNHIKHQQQPEFEVELDDLNQVNITIDSDKDELYEDAVKLVVQYRASISMLQRRLHIGHSRAARLIDMMEEEGIVGPYAGSKPREVLITEEELADYIDVEDNINGQETSSDSKPEESSENREGVE